MGLQLHIIAVGRMRAGPLRDLFEDYAGRLSSPLAVIEVEEKRQLSEAKLRQRESELLIAELPEGAILVMLDERGAALSSKDLAVRIRSWRDQGHSNIAFAIGGASGHHETTRARADLVLSLGPMTWPHMLVRGLLAEQLYRVQQILAGHPYHRE